MAQYIPLRSYHVTFLLLLLFFHTQTDNNREEKRGEEQQLVLFLFRVPFACNHHLSFSLFLSFFGRSMLSGLELGCERGVIAPQTVGGRLGGPCPSELTDGPVRWRERDCTHCTTHYPPPPPPPSIYSLQLEIYLKCHFFRFSPDRCVR